MWLVLAPSVLQRWRMATPPLLDDLDLIWTSTKGPKVRKASEDVCRQDLEDG